MERCFLKIYYKNVDKIYPAGYILLMEKNMSDKQTLRSVEDKKELKNRLNRIAGQISGIKKWWKKTDIVMIF